MYDNAMQYVVVIKNTTGNKNFKKNSIFNKLRNVLLFTHAARSAHAHIFHIHTVLPGLEAFTLDLTQTCRLFPTRINWARIILWCTTTTITTILVVVIVIWIWILII